MCPRPGLKNSEQHLGFLVPRLPPECWPQPQPGSPLRPACFAIRCLSAEMCLQEGREAPAAPVTKLEALLNVCGASCWRAAGVRLRPAPAAAPEGQAGT